MLEERDDINSIKLQIARLAYDITNIKLGSKGAMARSFDSLDDEWKNAFAHGVWEAALVAKEKMAEVSCKGREIRKDQAEDAGCFLFYEAKRLRDLHPGQQTYKRFSETLKASYNHSARKLYYIVEEEISEEAV